MDSENFAREFDQVRPHLTSVAFQIVGSVADAEDAVQAAWLKAAQSDPSGIANLPAWLTTITVRVALDALKARRRRRETPLDTAREEPQAEAADAEILLGDSISRALLVVLDRLSPAQRVAFVLHDVFAMPFDQIGVVLGRSPATAKKLASRARAKIHTEPTDTTPEVSQHTRIVAAFLDASRGGDIPTLLQLLAPDVVRTVDPILVPSGIATTIRGAREVAEETRQFATRAQSATVILVDGKPGIAIAPAGVLLALILVTVGRDDLIRGIRIVAGRQELANARLTLSPIATA